MSTDAIEALSFFFGTAATVWAAAYAWGKWLTHRYDGEKITTMPVHVPNLDPERIARLEIAIEALALELERVGEGQRYTTKLLEERLPNALVAGRPAPAAEGGRIVTPH